MAIDISNENIRELAIVLATALPVIAVAFYTVRNAETGDDDAGPNLLTLGPFFRTVLRAWPVAPVVTKLGAGLSSDGWRAVIRPDWRLRSDLGFIYRAAIAFVCAVSPFILGEDARVARVLLGLSLFLVVFSLNALIIYSAVIAALRAERYVALSAERASVDGGDLDSADTSELAVTVRPGGDSVVKANLVGFLTGLVAVAGGFLIAFSSP